MELDIQEGEHLLGETGNIRDRITIQLLKTGVIEGGQETCQPGPRPRQLVGLPGNRSHRHLLG
jgi:hypothetical protein